MDILDCIGVHLMDLPCTVRGYTLRNSDGSFSVVINARMSAEMQLRTYMHEVSHIEGDDFCICDEEMDVDLIEYKRHVNP